MPRRHRSKTMKGGFFEDLSNTFSNWGSSLSQGASSVWQKTKDTTSSLTGSTPSTSYTNNSYQSPMSTSAYGGKHSRRRRRMRGGNFKDNTPTTGLAVYAAPVSPMKSAQPHNLVGGRTKRRGRKGGFIAEAINQAVVPGSILLMQQKYKKGGRTRKHRRH